MDRFSVDLGLWDGHDLDRFAAFQPGVFPGLRVRGYDSKGLNLTRGVTGDLYYALPPTGKLRFDIALGGAVFASPEYYGEQSQYAYGTSVGVTFPGFWGTLLQARIKYGIDCSLPISGSQGSIRLDMFKTFDGWWPWTKSARQQ
jgi:hypothetical protein